VLEAGSALAVIRAKAANGGQGRCSSNSSSSGSGSGATSLFPQ